MVRWWPASALVALAGACASAAPVVHLIDDFEGELPSLHADARIGEMQSRAALAADEPGAALPQL